MIALRGDFFCFRLIEIVKGRLYISETINHNKKLRIMKQFSFIIRKSYSIVAFVVLCLGLTSCEFMQGMAEGMASYPMYGYGMSYNPGLMGYVAPAVSSTSGYTSTVSSASSSSSSTTRSSYTSSSSSGKMCRLCAGSGDCKSCDGKGFYYSPYDLSKKILCPNCHNHNGKCSSCGGAGYK